MTSDEFRHSPVALPPGCPRLSATPRETGSSTATKMIGSVVLARFAASVAGVPAVTKTVTPEPINSLMMAGSASVRSSAQRSKTAMSLPSVQPSAERLSPNVSRKRWFSCRDPAWIKPMRVISASAAPDFQALPWRWRTVGNRGVSFRHLFGTIEDI